MLSLAQKKTLLHIARHAITAHWTGEPLATVLQAEKWENSHNFMGVFVSLHVNEKLRGCIGNLEPTAPLPELVAEMAQAAATHDPRFAPLRFEELEEVVLEISLLYALEPLPSPNEIIIGRDGLMIRQGKKHGLLLPQVATRRNWDALTFLQHVCEKADLSSETWKNSEAELFRFRAEVFSDLVLMKT